MCGRFTQAQIAELDREVFKLLEIPRLEPRYNVAPTQDVAVVREGGRGEERRGERGSRGRTLAFIKWGLVPHWTDDPTIGNRLINARAETADQKPAFRDAFRERRCLVPADGFYEWQRTSHGKQPYYVRLADGGVLAFAGLWDRWVSPDGEPLESFTILTTKPNDVVAPIHDRMPVILPPDGYDRWLDPAAVRRRDLEELLQPYPADAMTAYPVSRYVNSPRNEGPQCVEPLDE
jgi:putative SOS response-associated peptidase YedK